MKQHKITTAVFPVAGLGTRFLPVTKTGPKEMLPIVDKPIILYAVEEAISAGITHLIFVTSSGKRSIEDFFDQNVDLERWLELHGKLEALKTLKSIIPDHIKVSYVRQPVAHGLGHAIRCAEHVVRDQPFAVLLPDDIIDTPGKTCLQSMVEIFDQHQNSVVAVESVAAADVSKYGIVALQDPVAPSRITNIVEKPSIKKAPSRLAVIGRYILTPAIFSQLANMAPGVGGEIQLTDAIASLLQQEEVYSYSLAGTRYDCGDKLSMVKATLTYALKRPEMRASLEAFIQEKIDLVEV